MKRIFQNIAILFMVVTLSSCLKSKELIGPDAPNGAGAIIEFDNPDFIASGSLTASVRLARYQLTLPKGTASQLKIRINYVGTGKPAPSDVTVGLGVDAAALTLHNTQASRTYTLLPSAWYVLPSSVVIPSGQNGVDITIPINTNNYVAGQTYAIPLSIRSTSVGTISGNFGTIIVAVAAQ
ncbi:DUF1735 domain-containing protein [Pedobacter jejuensis]|uniref:DUF1735 domain-containing protein n=1 Tax=Pedobacter jejuensis TaxID=1268550 RepID=A0A3N0BNX4_9SPHI|nr:DUF1735 domain-containing protein [Pedobacter jejuensis]RNL50544.1 DUF1735 domain-containing protein [Pedobacter jejuensis]